MRVISYTALHYGSDFLAYAIRSVIDHVDEHHILYSPVGSHGHRTELPCPDTRDELYAIAQAAAGDKLRWHDGDWTQEGQQRESIFEYAPDADVILVVDADEIWHPCSIEQIFNYCLTTTNSIPPFRNMRVPMVHFWRSFWKAVVDDASYPTRVIFPRIDAKFGENTWWGRPRYFISHMGYAQRADIIHYKQYTHGHKPEWRWDWYDTKFKPNTQEDIHPTNVNYWQPVDVDPLQYMPSWMAEHPYFSKAVIE